MKKLFFMLVLLFCVMSLFGQSLFILAQTGTPEQVNAAINAGAKIDDRDGLGWTPLMYAAAFNKNPDVSTALVNAGAKIDDRDGLGWTPLMHAAAFNENPEVITTLLNAGADAKAKSLGGKTAFDYAKNNPKLVNTPAYWELNNARF